MNMAELATLIKEDLTNRGWIQNAAMDEVGHRCLNQSLNSIMWNFDEKTRHVLLPEFADKVLELTGCSIVEFNDKPTTAWEDIVLLLKEMGAE